MFYDTLDETETIIYRSKFQVVVSTRLLEMARIFSINVYYYCHSMQVDAVYI